jgi:asparagine synthase (glutamine-hydrolysing)
VALMSQHLPTQFKTFSVGVREQDFNELPYARIVAERYGTDHIEHMAESQLMRLLPRMIWHLDEPSDPIAACMFHAAELAARHVKVVLGGDGGDELFAGFDRYLGVGYIDSYNVIPALVRSKIIGPLINSLPESFAYKSVSQRLKWVHYLSSLPDNAERYAQATIFFRFNHHEKKLLFNDDVWPTLEPIHSSNVIIDQYVQADADDVVDRMLYADFMTRLPEHSLMLTDRMTMAHSLEARSPFLDHTLVEFLAMFPSTMKIRGKTLKYALRKVAADYLPEPIIQRQKQGFMFPVAYWFRNELYEPTKRFLMDSHFVKDGHFKKERLLSLIEDHKNNKVDNHVRIWMLINLEIWYQLYIEQNDVVRVEELMKDYF